MGSEKQNDPVNHPSHYTDGIEVIDYIESKHFDYCLGNACKYISRCGKKEPGNIDKAIEDLEKAVWYINRRIQELRKEQSGQEVSE